MRLWPEHRPLLRTSALVTFFVVGLPVLLAQPREPNNFLIWLPAWLALGGALAANTAPQPRSERQQRLLIALQIAAVVIMVRVLCNGFEGTLLVLTAMQLGLLVSRREGLLWISAASALMFWGIATHWSVRPALLLVPPYFGFQLLALLTFQMLARESAARQELARTNAELRAMQEMFAETSRLGERLRISQELHDALGHHLTALSLNLELAAHQSEEPARANVRKAQSLARLLLGDVRDIVHSLNRQPGLPVESALRALIAGIPQPQIHLTVPAGLSVADPERAHVLIRCTQEIITNAIRHSGASNLWIEFVTTPGGTVEVRGRDDGRGAERFEGLGAGLSGMRRRLAALGGTLRIRTEPGSGFEVVAQLPLREATA